MDDRENTQLTIHGQVVTVHEQILWQTLRLGSPVGHDGTDEITALADKTGLSEDEVLAGIGGLLARGLVKHMQGRTREWFLARPDPSRPS